MYIFDFEQHSKYNLTFSVRDISYSTGTVDVVETNGTKCRMHLNPRDNSRTKVHCNFKKKL